MLISNRQGGEVPRILRRNCRFHACTPRYAICAGPDGCPHEGERLMLAVQQAQDRWIGAKRLEYGSHLSIVT